MSKVCAVVVTYNRPELLLENIHALISQEFKLQTILIVDNYSNKDTLVKLQDGGYINHFSDNFVKFGGEIKSRVTNKQGEEIEFIVLRLSKNIGGSGGFNKGMRYFYEKTTDDLIWIMDDDTIPYQSSLIELMKGYNYLIASNYNPGFICSRVLEVDHTHGNAPLFTTGNDIFKYFSHEYQFLSVDGCSFVSVLFTRKSLFECGLPIKEFFIWHDDLEYTLRMARKFNNVICLSSIVLHKRELSAAIEEITNENCFKYINGFRNEMFLNTEMDKPIRRIIRLIINRTRKIKNSKISNKNKLRLIYSLINGVLFFRPKREYFK